MAISPRALLKERERQERNSDSNYLKKFLYFFELRVPATLSPVVGTSFFFPLVLGPQSYSMTEPFTVEATNTQGGGLYVEENGIVQRTIKLSGTTGFKPRAFPTGANGIAALQILKPDQRSFNRRLRTVILTELSGQRHFHYLQDAVFRTYGDLKRDPSTAEETELVFHNPKDEESWLVVPQMFNLNREKDDRVQYRYEIELLAVGPADSSGRDFSEDKSILDNIKDAVGTVKKGLDLAQGGINDLTSMVNDLENTVKNVSVIIDNVTTIVGAANNFVDGVTDLIEVPYTLVNSTIELVEESLQLADNLEEAGRAAQDIPDNVKNKFRTMNEGLETIGMHPGSFETPAIQKLREIKKQQGLLTSTSQTRQDEALETSPPSSFSQSSRLGTQITEGDLISARGDINTGGGVFNYTGASQRNIEQGDTLVNLAARYLGDARLWQHIAIINGLKPPFVTEEAGRDLGNDDPTFPGALGIGGSILIPSFAKPPQQFPTLPVLGVRSDEPAEVHLLGTDFALEPVTGREGSQLYDVPVDVEGGSVDGKRVAGVPNIQQSVGRRLRTEKGTDTLYKRLGLGRIIGTNFTPVDVESARLKFIEAIDQDSRIASVRRVDFTDSSDDALIVDADVELRGFTETVNVKAVL